MGRVLHLSATSRLIAGIAMSQNASVAGERLRKHISPKTYGLGIRGDPHVSGSVRHPDHEIAISTIPIRKQTIVASAVYPASVYPFAPHRTNPPCVSCPELISGCSGSGRQLRQVDQGL